LGREPQGFDLKGGFFDAIRQDPVLNRCKLIAEPWDIGPGGYQLGQFPNVFAEWNDGYRDTVRRYWRGDTHSTQELGARLLGSAGEFDKRGRRAWSSVNLLTSHDGFTLADVTRYNERHNLANGENGVDGHNANYSDNCGVEGRTDDTVVRQRRRRRRRNMLATLFLSQGTPMVLAGDENSNSQEGNNNAYCQDNPTGWINWADRDEEMIAFVAGLANFRKTHRAVRQTNFLHGEIQADDGKPNVEWQAFDGGVLQWRDPGLSNFCLVLRCSTEAAIRGEDNVTVFIAFNRSYTESEVVLPKASAGHQWVRRIDTAAEQSFPHEVCQKGSARVEASSVTVFTLEPDEIRA
jgi:glycogen operon protein